MRMKGSILKKKIVFGDKIYIENGINIDWFLGVNFFLYKIAIYINLFFSYFNVCHVLK